MNNQFVFLICSYNNEQWVAQNIESVLSQTYTNFRIVYYNAASTDKTYELVKEYADKDKRIHLYTTPERHIKTWFLQHLSDYETIQDGDIICILDGDDFLANEEVLYYLNEVYNKSNCWITYGGMTVWNGGENTDEPFPQNTESPLEIKQNKLYRQDLWRYSHFRTYRGFLWNRIKKEDWMSNGQYIMIEDLMTMYPCLEMCPSDKIFRIDQTVYVLNYSEANGGSRGCTENKINNIGQIQEAEVRSRPKYPELSIVMPTLVGGLGNLMFEVAAAAALAKDNNAVMLVNNNDHYCPNQGRNINNYINNVFSKTVFDTDISIENIHEQTGLLYKPILYSPNMRLKGHYQALAYFDHHKKYIQDLFGPTQEIENELNEKFEWLKDCTAIQVRRGDALEERCIGYHPIPTLNYLYEAAKRANPSRIIIFSDDMKWCKENLKFDVPCDFTVCQGESRDYMELYMMARCKNVIISNSTFGWWGAYLNQREDKQVYVPSLWFGPKLIQQGFDINELIPLDWIKI